MSFSKDVKEELLGIYPKARHCMVAELAGIILMQGFDSFKSLSEDALNRKVLSEGNIKNECCLNLRWPFR